MLLEVKDSKFVRDTNSMALINKDNSARDDYYSKAKLVKTQKEEINSMRADLSSVKEDIQELKDILRQLLGKGSNG